MSFATRSLLPRHRLVETQNSRTCRSEGVDMRLLAAGEVVVGVREGRSTEAGMREVVVVMVVGWCCSRWWCSRCEGWGGGGGGGGPLMQPGMLEDQESLIQEKEDASVPSMSWGERRGGTGTRGQVLCCCFLRLSRRMVGALVVVVDTLV